VGGENVPMTSWEELLSRWGWNAYLREKKKMLDSESHRSERERTKRRPDTLPQKRKLRRIAAGMESLSKEKKESKSSFNAKKLVPYVSGPCHRDATRQESWARRPRAVLLLNGSRQRTNEKERCRKEPMNFEGKPLPHLGGEKVVIP